MGLGSQLGNAVVGNIQKALLVIHRQEDAAEVDSARVAAATEAALGGTAASMLATSAAMKAAKMKACVMQVQYNPSSLSIQANAESIPFAYLQQNVDSGVPNQSSRPPMVMLSVELVFDAMNPKDAFMAEKLSLSTGGVVSSAAAAKQLTKGGYTVQPQTDGLIAALLRPSTRVVTFRWADMAFTGQLIEAQAEYTMFSVSGKPIRSKVHLNIAQQVESEADIKYWDAMFDKMVGNGALEQSKGAAQTMGNLLNLNAF